MPIRAGRPSGRDFPLCGGEHRCCQRDQLPAGVFFRADRPGSTAAPALHAGGFGARSGSGQRGRGGARFLSALDCHAAGATARSVSA